MKRKIQKRIGTIFLSVLMLIGLMSSAVSAAPTIDMSQTGSITLIKEVTGTNAKLENVIFYQWKVADIAQVEDSGTIVVAYTNVNADLLDELGNPAPSFVYDSNDYYYATDLQDALITAFGGSNSQTVLVDLIKDTGNGDAMTPTDSDGETTVSGLEVGLYLIVETDYPAIVRDPADPFFISVPSNRTADPDSYDYEEDLEDWIYNITAIPKNSTQEIELDKWILTEENNANDPTDDTLSKGEDYQIGDDVPYRINADVPSTITQLHTYTIGDMLSAGLTFKPNSVKVYGVKTTDSSTELLTSPTHYTVSTVPGDQIAIFPNGTGGSVGTSTFIVEFVPGALGAYKEVYIEYEAILNEDAKIYTDANPNYVTLVYSRDTGDSSSPLETVRPKTPEPKVYTYKVEVTKQLEGAAKPGVDITDVKFELRDMNGNAIAVTETTAGYVVSEDGSGSDVITVSAGGTVTIIGLEGGQYQLVEIATASGHTLLKEAIIINIHAAFAAESFPQNPAGDFFQIVAGQTYYAGAGATRKLIDLTGFAPNQYVEFPGVITNEPGIVVQKHDHATGETGHQIPTVTSNFPINAQGVIQFTVVNKEGFDFPTTGGIGTYIFTIGGFGLIALALLLINKKNKLKNS